MNKDLADLRREPWRFGEVRLNYPAGTAGTGPIANHTLGEEDHKNILLFNSEGKNELLKFKKIFNCRLYSPLYQNNYKIYFIIC